MTPLSRRGPVRFRVLLARGAALAACGILAAACGSAAAPGTTNAASKAPAGTLTPSSSAARTPSATASTSASSAAARAHGQVSLTITLSGDSAMHWTLQCEPAGGSVPDPQAACQRLLNSQNVFITSPHHVMCPQMMADGPSYVVSGTFLGVRVHDAIVDGGCDQGKWNVLHEILP